MTTPLPISGFVLAGGRSIRMGRDKALLPLAGKPLIARAVTKLRRICASVHILTANPSLAAYAPIVPDTHPNSGPIGGIEAALTHTPHDWNLFLPVDVPYFPAAVLDSWARQTMAEEVCGARISFFVSDGRAHPALSLLHRDVTPFIAQAVQARQFSLHIALEHAGTELANRLGVDVSQCLRRFDVSELQQSARRLWFLNLNTPEDLALAEANAASLDP